MFEPTAVTWTLLIVGWIVLTPLALAQLTILFDPHGQRTKDILIAKGEDWRNETHFRLSLGMAIADWLLVIPLLVAGSAGVILGQGWGYVLWVSAGACTLYINIILFAVEKKYVYPSRGPWIYYTYYWGFFVYWGAAVIVYSALRLAGFGV